MRSPHMAPLTPQPSSVPPAMVLFELVEFMKGNDVHLANDNALCVPCGEVLTYRSRGSLLGSVSMFQTNTPTNK